MYYLSYGSLWDFHKSYYCDVNIVIGVYENYYIDIRSEVEFMLVRMKIKSAFKYMPHILLGMVVFVVIILGITTGAVYMSQGDSDNDKMSVAIVIDENAGIKEQQYVKTAFDFIQNMDSVNAVCDFTAEYTIDEAVELLRSHKITALIRIPKGFIDGIMNGKNVPAVVYFNGKATNFSSQLLRYMMEAGASDLSTAQAGIYAFEDVYKYMVDNNSEASVNNLSNDVFNDSVISLNKSYFSYALDRGIYFKTEKIKESNSLNTMQFYFSSGVVMLLMFTTLTCGSFYNKDSKTFRTQIKRKGIISGSFGVSKTIGLTVVLGLLYGVAYLLVSLSSIRYIQVRQLITFNNSVELKEYIIQFFISLGALVFLIFSIYSMAGAVYSCIKDDTAGVLVLFFIVIAIIFVSGMIMPSAILPVGIRNISNYLPAYWYMKLAGQIITGTVSLSVMVINVLYTALFIVITSFAEKIRY